ncbi:hypothetical protein J31TS4_01600 [Paenibacillus sp. J31TS4]|uniref:DUF3243 domain-containing protein n=1 Tax=Paenibacillus sp. J31TS4 TaxID=2807195 RepID=UPI001B2E8ED8|nr:DUF3243 domain-containing protein [Paenibacillus sp. J31TS4]GIP36880.1 hypothetical protein J31TS4_01600 [Paenibacillus sp. J31TS4]
MDTTVLKSFDKWKEFLAERVGKAEQSGMSEETISKLAYEIGGFLADKIDPKNNEERVLKELWDVGNEDERKTIARLMIRWVGQSK